jgi:hypothetical protein
MELVSVTTYCITHCSSSSAIQYKILKYNSFQKHLLSPVMSRYLKIRIYGIIILRVFYIHVKLGLRL